MRKSRFTLGQYALTGASEHWVRLNAGQFIPSFLVQSKTSHKGPDQLLKHWHLQLLVSKCCELQLSTGEHCCSLNFTFNDTTIKIENNT